MYQESVRGTQGRVAGAAGVSRVDPAKPTQTQKRQWELEKKAMGNFMERHEKQREVVKAKEEQRQEMDALRRRTGPKLTSEALALAHTPHFKRRPQTVQEKRPGVNVVGLVRRPVAAVAAAGDVHGSNPAASSVMDEVARLRRELERMSQGAKVREQEVARLRVSAHPTKPDGQASPMQVEYARVLAILTDIVDSSSQLLTHVSAQEPGVGLDAGFSDGFSTLRMERMNQQLVRLSLNVNTFTSPAEEEEQMEMKSKL